MLINIFFFAVLAAAVALLYDEGVWGNAINLINVVMAALLATNFYEPLARWFESQEPTYTFFWDFLAVWALFAVFMGVFRAVTDQLSRTKVRFLSIVDRIGGPLLAVWIGWVLVCFTAMTLHMAPMSRVYCNGTFDPEQAMFLGTAPDRQWLAFAQSVSRGSFSRALKPKEQKAGKYRADAEYPSEDAFAVFDRHGEFLPKYATVRSRLEQFVKVKKAFRVPSQDVVPSR
jgi:uncharacterized membrane protein required for colicin V production